MRPAWQSAWKSPTRRPAWSARRTTRRRRCTCIIWRGWIGRRPWEKSGAWCNEEAYRHHSGAGGGGRGGLDLPRKRKEDRQPDCGLGDYRGDRRQNGGRGGGGGRLLGATTKKKRSPTTGLWSRGISS